MTHPPNRAKAPIDAGSCDARPVSWYFACDLPFCLVLNGDFSASIGVGVASFHFTIVGQESKDPRVGEGQYDLQPDRYGLASYTHVRCELQWDVYLALARSFGLHETDEVAIAFFCVNRAAQAYRHATNAYWIRPISKHGLFRLETGRIAQSGDVSLSVRETFGGTRLTLPRRALKPEVRQAFVDRLSTAWEPSIWRDLLLDAQDSLERGQFRSAVVDAHTAIETLSSAVVLASLRETYSCVEEAIKRETDNDRQAQGLKGKEPASLEDLLADVPDSVMFRKALEKAMIGNTYEEGPILRWFAELAQMRNAAVHQGGDVSPEEALRQVSSAKEIACLLVDAYGAARLAGSRAGPVVYALAQYLHVPIQPCLRGWLEELGSSGQEVLLKRARDVKPPMGSCVFETCRVLRGNRQVELIVPSPSVQRKHTTDVQSELAMRLAGNHLILNEGWPNADVMSSAPVDHEAFSAAANLLTQVALTQEVVTQCRSASYDPSPGLSRFLESQLVSASERLGGQQPAAFSYDYFVLPLLLVRLQFHTPEALHDEPLKLLEGMKWVTDVYTRLAEISGQLDLHCRTDAATWILASKVVLLGGDFDTIGIREDPDRRLRTHLTPEEFARLGWKRR